MRKNVRDLTRGQIEVEVKENPTSGDLQLSALLRIADALELMTVPQKDMKMEIRRLRREKTDLKHAANQSYLKYEAKYHELANLKQKIKKTEGSPSSNN